MTTFHRNYVALIVAIAMALVVALPTLLVNKPDLPARMVLAAALYLLSQDVLAGTAISKGERGLSNPNRWVYAFYLSLNFGTFMLLALWGGVESLAHFMPRILIGATLFGLMLGLFTTGPEYRFRKHFLTEEPIGKLFYLWPIVVLLLVPVQIYLMPHLTVTTLFLFPIGFGFLIPRYKRVLEGSALWTNMPRLVGFALLALVTLFYTLF